jgi:hypothetical protein
MDREAGKGADGLELPGTIQSIDARHKEIRIYGVVLVDILQDPPCLHGMDLYCGSGSAPHTSILPIAIFAGRRDWYAWITASAIFRERKSKNPLSRPESFEVNLL